MQVTKARKVPQPKKLIPPTTLRLSRTHRHSVPQPVGRRCPVHHDCFALQQREGGGGEGGWGGQRDDFGEGESLTGVVR